MQRAPQFAHEFPVCHRDWADGVECAGQFIALDGLDEHPAQIANVNPTDELFAAANGPAEKTFRQSGQNRQRAAIAPQHKSDPQQNAARLGSCRRIEGGFPRLANSSQRVISRRGAFVAQTVFRIAIKPDGARLHPDARRTRHPAHRGGDGANRIHARRREFAKIFRRVSAFDVAPGEIDHGFRAIEKFNPFAGIFPVPQNFLDAVVACARRAREHDHFVISREQFLRERPAEKAAAARQHDALLVHAPDPSNFNFGAFAAVSGLHFEMRPLQTRQAIWRIKSQMI